MAAIVDDAVNFPEFYAPKPVEVFNKRGSVRFKITFGKGLDESKKNSLVDDEETPSTLFRPRCALLLAAFLIFLVIILILFLCVYLVE